MNAGGSTLHVLVGNVLGLPILFVPFVCTCSRYAVCVYSLNKSRSIRRAVQQQWVNSRQCIPSARRSKSLATLPSAVPTHTCLGRCARMFLLRRSIFLARAGLHLPAEPRFLRASGAMLMIRLPDPVLTSTPPSLNIRTANGIGDLILRGQITILVPTRCISADEPRSTRLASLQRLPNKHVFAAFSIYPFIASPMATAQRQRIPGATVDAAASKTCIEPPTQAIVQYLRPNLVHRHEARQSANGRHREQSVRVGEERALKNPMGCGATAEPPVVTLAFLGNSHVAQPACIGAWSPQLLANCAGK